jgi:D-alanyl-D-alanine-carboxypeptidase/D-alanyl-D-alanine-endopeptidase
LRPENPFADYDLVRLREFLVEKGVAKPADAKYLYSDTGLGLLGYALALRAGLSYEQLIKREITGPLHMDDTVITLSLGQRTRLIQGHGPAFEPAAAFDFDVLAGAAAVKSTAADLLNYLEANLHPKSLAIGAHADLPAATLPAALMTDHESRADVSPPNVRIALAWFFNKPADIFFHNGLTGGASAHLEFNPTRERAIVVLYNRQDLTPGQMQFVDRIATNINQLMSGEPAIPLDYLSDIDRVTLAYVKDRK